MPSLTRSFKRRGVLSERERERLKKEREKEKEKKA
jgi:hypothetical protein